MPAIKYFIKCKCNKPFPLDNHMANFLLTQIWGMYGSKTQQHLSAEKRTVVKRLQHEQCSMLKTID